MIERHWKGIAKRARARDYITHLQQDTFKQTAGINGFVAAKILQRDVAAGVEFLIITTWSTLNAIEQFAGSNIELAVVPAYVKEIMVRYDERVSHYELGFTTETANPPGE